MPRRHTQQQKLGGQVVSQLPEKTEKRVPGRLPASLFPRSSSMHA